MQARILIVDDRSTNLRIYEQFVKMMGPDYVAKCFDNPSRALSWLDENHADLLIIDYRMPEINGADFIRKIRSKAIDSDIPAIMITAHQDREYRLAALDAGATDFLQSPVSHTEFSQRAKTLLAQYRRKNELSCQTLNQQAGTNNHSNDIIQGTSILEQVIDSIPIIICATGIDNKILFMNNYQAAMLGDEQEYFIGRNINDFFAEDTAVRNARRDQIILKTSQAIPHFEETFHSDDIEMIFHCNKAPLLNKEGETIGVLSTGVDITARKYAEQHRAHLALHDILTGLPNRALLAERIKSSVEECTKADETAALLLLDLDRFKIINDTKGHQTGDILLREVAERINNILQPDDFAARIGGDEFAIILRNVKSAEQINSRCKQLIRSINEPYSIAGISQVVGASIGIALIPTDANDPDELLRLADLAMYDAKANGRNRSCFFSPELNNIAQANATLEIELRKALVEGEFTLEYQPIVNASDGAYVGGEALVRWNHPKQGYLLPIDFLGVANDCGLIDDIGLYVIEAACKQIQKMSAMNIYTPQIAVNISPRQFNNCDVYDIIKNLTEKYAIDASKLTIEITEELLLDQNNDILRTLSNIRDLGVGIAIDDFGTGYSSLQYLRDLPATCLKIDRAFISRIEASAADRAIISTITHLAHAFSMRVVAEGVETQNQYDLLKAAGVDSIQGYLMGQPMKVSDFENIFIEKQKYVKMD